ncbi:MAG: peptidoglycan DD-metalloendopeptidase family protein [Candidatus Paceibacterota bacterium]|jgi:murein DD-endopeptidase MepM/ murein hydrolase activator NlpD
MHLPLLNFKQSYNSTNPFGAFPDRKNYPKTGTHVGTDFKVAVGTPIFAPCDGEMFKTEVNKYKGNVGVFIFDYEGTTWGLELCHLKELPTKGIYKEGDIIAHSGNTGSATTGAHLHAVLHLGAKVTQHYKELQTREDFLRLEKAGEIVDCYKWFCDRILRSLF